MVSRCAFPGASGEHVERDACATLSSCCAGAAALYLFLQAREMDRKLQHEQPEAEIAEPNQTQFIGGSPEILQRFGV